MTQESTDPQRWAIVGGGFLGLTLAHRLARLGHRVTIIEQAESLGGLATAWNLDGITWDRHYHVTLLSDRPLRSLLAELGLEQDMRWVQTRTGFYTDGELHSMSNSLEFIKFPPLGLVDKLRLAVTVLYASRIRNWRRLEQVRVERWLRRWSGARTTDKIWIPLLRSKLGDSYGTASAACIWATIDRMYAARRSGLKREMFGYVPGGYARILDALRERLTENGVYLMLGTRVRRIESDPPVGVTVETGLGSRIQFDRVVLTVPTPTAAYLCPGLTDDEQSRLGSVEYLGIVCASVLLKKPLAGYYITNITESWVPFTGVIEMSALVDQEQFGGHTLVYLPKYLPSGDSAFTDPDEVWQETFLSALYRMYPELSEDDVLSFRVSRERYVQPLWTLGYSNDIPSKTTSLPGVFVVNSAQIIDAIPTVNQAIRLADESLPVLLEGDLVPMPGTTTGNSE